MKNKLYFIVCVVLAFAVVAWAGPIEDRGNRLWTGEQTFDGVIQELSDKTDGTSLCFEGTTSDAYETCFLFTDPTADRVITFGDANFSAGATNAHTDIVTITKITSGTNTVQDAITMDISGADTTTGFGAGIVWKLEDDTGTTTEEHGSIDVVITDGTSTTEDSDMVFKIMTNGDVTEVGRFVAAKSASTGDSFQIFSNTTEQNAVIDVFELTAGVGSVSVNNMGLGITFNVPDDTGTDAEEFARIDAIMGDVSAATTQGSLHFSVASANSVATILQLTGNASSSTADTINILANTTETNAVLDIFTISTVGATAATGGGLGIGILFNLPDDGDATTNQNASIDVVQTSGADGTEDTDFVFSQMVNGSIEARVRFDADDDTILLTGTTPKMTIGDGGDEDAILTFDGQTNDFYIGFDTTDDLLNIGVGSTPGTTVAIEVTAAAAIIIPVGITYPTEVITSTNAIGAEECGTTYFLNNAVGFVSTLPAPSGLAGCEFTFIVQTLPTSSTLNIVTSGSSNIMVGHIDDIADAAGTSTTTGDTINFVNSTSDPGDKCYMITNGTSWYFNCITGTASGITVATD